MALEVLARGAKYRIERDSSWPAGQRRAMFTVHDQHYLDDAAQWQEVVEAFEDDATPGFSHKAERMRHRIRVAEDGTRRWYPRRNVPGEYAEFGRPQYWTGSDWQDVPLGTPTHSGSKIVWDRPNFALSLSVDWNRVKLDLVLKNSNAARRMRWPVGLVGLTWDDWTLRSGVTTVAEILKPVGYDSTPTGMDRGSLVPIVTSYAAGYVEFTADLSSVVYPVYIDPTFSSTQTAADADNYLESTAPDNNEGADTVIVSGGYASPNQPVRGLLQIDISSLPASMTVISANLALYCESEASTTDYVVGAHRSLVQWYEGTKVAAVPGAGENASVWNYRNYNGSVAWNGGAGGGSGSDYAASATDSKTITAPSTWFNYNILADISAWYGGSSNYGWWLINTSENTGDSRKRFTSSDGATAGNRPLLTITYTPGVLVGWPSTVASIPGGWTRETFLDGKHIRGSANGVDPGGTGGANTHNHATSSHTHTESSAHTHTSPNSGNSSGTTSTDPGSVQAPDAHAHNTNNNSGNPSGSISSATPDTTADNNEPSYLEVIFIGQATPTGLPANCVAFWNTTTAPTGWTFCDGGGGTPDARNRYLKGAAAAGNGGGTGGNATHTHTISAHNHGNWAHTHADATSAGGSGSGTGAIGSGSGRSSNLLAHTHVMHYASATATIAVNTNSASGTSSNDPPYKNLALVKNTSGGDSLPAGIICFYIGTNATIPAGWALCNGSIGTPDMRTYYAKCPNTIAGVGGSGGSLTSSHTSASHDHSVASHQHNMTHDAGATYATTATGTTAAINSHTHTWGPSGNQTSSWGSTAVTITDNTSVQPAYYDIAFIQKQITIPATQAVGVSDSVTTKPGISLATSKSEAAISVDSTAVTARPEINRSNVETTISVDSSAATARPEITKGVVETAISVASTGNQQVISLGQAASQAIGVSSTDNQQRILVENAASQAVGVAEGTITVQVTTPAAPAVEISGITQSVSVSSNGNQQAIPVEKATSSGIGVGENAELSITLAVNKSDSLAAADSPTESVSNPMVSKQDAIGLSDVGTPNVVSLVAKSDTVSVQDRIPYWSDLIALSESVQASVVTGPIDLAASQNVSVSDSSPQALIGVSIGASQGVILTENALARSSLDVTRSDAAGVGESRPVAILLSVLKSEGVGVTDSPQESLAVLAPNRSEVVGVTDTRQVALAALTINKSEAIAAADSSSSSLALATAKSEGVSVADSHSLALLVIVVNSDGVTVGESRVTAIANLVILTDSAVSVASNPIIVLGLSESVTQAVSVATSPTATISVQSSKSDDVAILATPTVALLLQVSKSEAVGVGDTTVVDALVVRAIATDTVHPSESTNLLLPEAGAIYATAQDSVTVGENRGQALSDSNVSSQQAIGVTTTPQSDVVVAVAIQDSVGVAEVAVVAPEQLLGTVEVISIQTVTLAESSAQGIGLRIACSSPVAVGESVNAWVVVAAQPVSVEAQSSIAVADATQQMPLLLPKPSEHVGVNEQMGANWPLGISQSQAVVMAILLSLGVQANLIYPLNVECADNQRTADIAENQRTVDLADNQRTVEIAANERTVDIADSASGAEV